MDFDQEGYGHYQIIRVKKYSLSPKQHLVTFGNFHLAKGFINKASSALSLILRCTLLREQRAPAKRRTNCLYSLQLFWGCCWLCSPERVFDIHWERQQKIMEARSRLSNPAARGVSANADPAPAVWSRPPPPPPPHPAPATARLAWPGRCTQPRHYSLVPLSEIPLLGRTGLRFPPSGSESTPYLRSGSLAFSVAVGRGLKKRRRAAEALSLCPGFRRSKSLPPV